MINLLLIFGFKGQVFQRYYQIVPDLFCLTMMKMWQLKSNLKVKILRAELEDQEKSLKASVAAQVQNDLLC